ncbi:MAG: hypothetical protein DLM73_15710 [Chthoniobacterales bacterium]|nr:MAG: hypothetical protein DLM73_15710 [Chthoniobacterales bacterium]
MSERSDVAPIPEGEFIESNRFAGLSTILALLGLIGLGLSVVGAFVSRHQFSFSWLFAFAFYFTLIAGCFFWIIVHHVTDAEWSVVVRRQLENLAMLMPLMVLFFVPIVIFRHHLYEWMNIPLGHDPVLDSKRAYLNWHFFLVRSIFYFVFFIGATLLFRRFSIAQDRDGNPGFTLKMRKLAFVALPLFGLSLTFGAYDWLLGIDYHWFSTMWGVYIFAGAAGSSMSLLVLVTAALQRAGYLKETVTTEHYHIMGKWMLSFVVFWAYIGFSQYMLIWYANMPEETEYFIRRNTESWNALSLFLVIGRFFIPFAILLLRSPKKKPQRLSLIAGWIVFMQMVDLYIVILPALHGTGVHVTVWDFMPLLGMGATLAFFYLRIAAKTSLFPNRDPRLLESLRTTN